MNIHNIGVGIVFHVFYDSCSSSRDRTNVHRIRVAKHALVKCVTLAQLRLPLPSKALESLRALIPARRIMKEM